MYNPMLGMNIPSYGFGAGANTSLQPQQPQTFGGYNNTVPGLPGSNPQQVGFGFDPKQAHTATTNTNTNVDPSGGWFSRESMFGGTDANGNMTGGWVNPAIQGAGVLANSWLGFQQLDLGRDALALQQDAWDMHLGEYEYNRAKRDAKSDAYAEGKRQSQSASL